MLMAGASIHRPMHAAQFMVLWCERGSNGPQTEISAYTRQNEMSSRSADSISELVMVPLPSGQMRQSNRNQSAIYCSNVQRPAHQGRQEGTRSELSEARTCLFTAGTAGSSQYPSKDSPQAPQRVGLAWHSTAYGGRGRRVRNCKSDHCQWEQLPGNDTPRPRLRRLETLKSLVSRTAIETEQVLISSFASVYQPGEYAYE